jgi:MFS family permease
VAESVWWFPDIHQYLVPSSTSPSPTNLTSPRGFTLTFGAFQAYYKSDLLVSSSPSAISWIGTVQAWLLILVGVLSGPLFDRGYFRSMLYIGNFLVVLGIMMLSLCTEYWQVFLAQGICMGLGAGLLYIPSLALVSIWFDRKRALAMGVVMSGIAVGGFKPYSIG